MMISYTAGITFISVFLDYCQSRNDILEDFVFEYLEFV